MYDVTIGIFSRGTTVLIALLNKATEHPDAASFPTATLIEDMKPLTFHVQSMWNTTVKTLKKLGVSEMEAWEDEDPVAMAQLIERAEKLKAFLDGFQPATLEGKDTEEMQVWGGMGTGKQFVLSLGVPNFFFHLQTVYSILRMKGVPLGKADYLDPWQGSWE